MENVEIVENVKCKLGSGLLLRLCPSNSVNNIVVISLNSMLRLGHKKWSHSTMPAVCLAVCFYRCVCEFVCVCVGVSVFAICKYVRIGRHL